MELQRTALAITLAMLMGCSPSAAEKKHKEDIKAILSKTTSEQTQKALGGFGPVGTPEKASECLSKRLNEWQTGELVHYVGVRPANLLLAKLLDFNIVGISSKGDHFLATVNLQVELSGAVGMIGGGATANRQIQHKIFKDTGIILLAE